jgi:phage-related protein
MATPRKGTRLTRQDIRRWCEAHRERTGRFPAKMSGPVHDHPDITWATIDKILKRGNRWLEGGSTLAKFLLQEFNAVDRRGIRTVSAAMILQWADAHHARTGQWPTVRGNGQKQDPIPESPGDDWRLIDAVMRRQGRGYKGPRSLRALLSKHHGEKYRYWLAPLLIKQIVDWAEAHKRRTGEWPTPRSGAIPEAPPNTWSRVNESLIHGKRGLIGGISLNMLLARHRGKLTFQSRGRGEGRGIHIHRTPLVIEQILRWADAYRQRTGDWPRVNSGPVHEAPDENWGAIHSALAHGARGLRGGSTLMKLLIERRGAISRKATFSLSVEQILAWADAYHERTGEWPTRHSGSIAPGVQGKWMSIENALSKGSRGLGIKSSIAKLLQQHRGVRRGTNRPPLTLDQIRLWAEHHRITLRDWPTEDSGPVLAAPQENWKAIAHALRVGVRGLPAGNSLSKLLHGKHRKRKA